MVAAPQVPDLQLTQRYFATFLSFFFVGRVAYIRLREGWRGGGGGVIASPKITKRLLVFFLYGSDELKIILRLLDQSAMFRI
jgi:hypothetical protein